MTTEPDRHGITTELQPLAYPIHLLDELPGNPNVGADEAVAASYAEFGQLKPIVAVRQGRSKRGTVVAGNTQLRGARDRLGWTQIAVVWIKADDDRAAAFALTDNRTAELSTTDEAALLAMYESITDEALRAVTGYTEDWMADLRRELNPSMIGLPPTDDVPSVLQPVSKPLDVWQLGDHRVMCGDATKAEHYIILMAGPVPMEAALIWTDPPYGVDYTGGQHKKDARERIAGDKDATLYGAALGPMLSVTHPRAPIYLWHAGSEARAVYEALEANHCKVRSQIIWNKLNPHYAAYMAQYMQRHEPCLYAHRVGQSPYWYGPTNEVSVWDVEQPSRNELHPTQKPIDLATRAITNSSQENEAVLDPFGGSGTCLMACEATGRIAYTMDIDPIYVDTMCLRWQLHTGRKPVLESTGEPHNFEVPA
jgi:DNA modification methylase